LLWASISFFLARGLPQQSQRRVKAHLVVVAAELEKPSEVKLSPVSQEAAEALAPWMVKVKS
jgi:hypothetical protein